MPLSPDTRLGSYEIVSLLGAGGMGEVYKAKDLKLGRDVAIKVLREDLASDPERLRRFEQEARAASSLNHPNIVTIYDIGEHEGTRYIAMEYVEGRTLREMLSGEPLPTKKLLKLATQIADGLAKAHSAGIVHRDLKPENLMVTSDGFIKILDFGLAKLTPQVLEAGPDVATLARQSTSPGVVMGTVGYMSPEQAKGEPTDFRSDQFSFGTVLYEAASGKRPFLADTPGEIQVAIIRDEPEPLANLNSSLPAPFRWIVERCLAKDPEGRYGTTSDLAKELHDLKEHLSEVPSQPIAPAPLHLMRPGRRAVVTLLGVLAVALAIALFAVLPGRRPPTIATLPWAYEGPSENAPLAQMAPLAVNDRLRTASSLQVTPFSTSRNYGPEEDGLALAEQLGVDWVVQGRIVVRNGSLEARLTLVGPNDTPEGWPTTVVGDPQDVLALADAVSVRIATALSRDALSGSSSMNREALESYLEGKLLLESWDQADSYVSAEEAFRHAISEDEGFAAAYAGLARAVWRRYLDTGDTQLVTEALSHANKAVALDPAQPEAYLALGVVQLGRGRTVQAESSFQKAQELAPEDDEVSVWIARAYSRLGRYEDAERMYQRAIDLRPGHWSHYDRKGLYLESRGELDAAKELFRKVIELRPESGIGYNHLAVAHIMSGELQDAEPLLQAVLAMQPDGSAHINLGFVYYSTERFEKAAEQFRRAVEMSPSSALSWANLGDAYRQLVQVKKADDAYAHALELAKADLEVNPDDSDSRVGYAMSLAGLRQCSEATEQINLALADEQHAPAFLHYYAALAYAVCADETKALHHTKKAIEGGFVVDVRISPDLKFLLDEPEIKKLLR